MAGFNRAETVTAANAEIAVQLDAVAVGQINDGQIVGDFFG